MHYKIAVYKHFMARKHSSSACSRHAPEIFWLMARGNHTESSSRQAAHRRKAAPSQDIYKCKQTISLSQQSSLFGRMQRDAVQSSRRVQTARVHPKSVYLCPEASHLSC